MNNTLTKNEYAILHLLWTENIPLSKSGIIERSPEKSWSSNSIHILLNSLIDKGAVEVDGFVRTGRNYGRTYKAIITQEDYVKMQMLKNANFDGSDENNFMKLYAAILEHEDLDIETINELERILRKKRKECSQ